MNCHDVDSILDTHRTRSLSAAQRANVDAHLSGCARCADAWFVQETLLNEPIAAPRANLFGDTVHRLGRQDSVAERRDASRWIPLAGPAAAAALAAVAALFLQQLDTGSGEAPRTDARMARTAEQSAAAFHEGTHYQRLPLASSAASSAGRIEVAEFFMYGCLPCFSFEPRLEQWQQSAPDYVDLVRVPAMFNAAAILHARAFYAAEALGIAEEMHAAFFEEIHVNGNPLDSVELLAAFFGRFGVEAATFASRLDSVAVAAKVEQARKLSSEYRIPATPSIVVNGKYLTLAALAGSYENWFAIIDELAASERAAGDQERSCIEPPSRAACPARR